MFQRVIDNFRDSTGIALRQTALAAMAAICLFVTTGFLCAAAFIAVLNRYGPIAACLTAAGLFFIITMIAAGIYLVRKRQASARAAAQAKTAARTFFADPALLATGIQLARVVGVKRLIPILAIGGLALGLMASRSQSSEPPQPE